MSTPDNTAETTDDLSGFESRLSTLRAEAADAAKHEAEWSKAKAIKKGSALGEYVDDALSSFLTRRVEESARDVDALERHSLACGCRRRIANCRLESPPTKPSSRRCKELRDDRLQATPRRCY